MENPLKGERVRLSDHSGLSSWFDLNSSFPLATKGNNAEARYVGIDTRNIKITDILDHPLQDADNARNFDFPLDFTADPMTWINASVTQAFYTINMVSQYLFLSWRRRQFLLRRSQVNSDRKLSAMICSYP